jgi:predicted DsbA family dithiol-disulfide isomerase
MWAESHPAWEDLHARLFRAYWAESADLEDDGVLVDLANAAGIDRDEATSALMAGAGLEDVHESKAAALDLGIGATPGWHFGDRVVFTGVHPDAVMDRIIERTLDQGR